MAIRNEIESIVLETIEEVKQEMKEESLINFEALNKEYLKALEPIIRKLECLEESVEVLESLQTNYARLEKLIKELSRDT